MKLEKEIIVQIEDQEPKMKVTISIVVEIEDQELNMKLAKDIVFQTEDEEPKEKLALCIPSYKEKLIPFHLHENLICDLCKTWEEYINKVEAKHKNTMIEL